MSGRTKFKKLIRLIIDGIEDVKGNEKFVIAEDLFKIFHKHFAEKIESEIHIKSKYLI